MDTLPIFARFETILAVLPGITERDRILIAKIVSRGCDDVVELRQQSFGDGVGWFTQSSIPMTAEQAASFGNAIRANETQDSPVHKRRAAAILQKAENRGLALVR
jgi:hypothetical protein